MIKYLKNTLSNKISLLDWFFLVFISTLPFSNVGNIKIDNFSILPSQLLIFIFVFSWFLLELSKKDRSIKVPRTHLDLALVVFLLVNILSIYQSYNIPVNYSLFAFPTIRNKPFLKSISQIILLIPGVLSYYMTVTFLRSRESIVKAIKVWLFTMSAISLFGIYQFIGYYLKLPFADYGTQSFYLRYLGSLPILRVNSVSLEPTLLASYLVAFLPLSLILFFGAANLIKQRHLLITIILTSFFCLILTFSTNSILMLIFISILLIYLLRYWDPELFGRIALFSSIIIFFILFSLYKEIIKKIVFFWNTNDYEYHISAFHRVVCWKTAFNMFLRHPLLGVGIGNFAFFFLDNIPSPKIIELMIHTGMPRIINNIYLEVLAETGIFGFFAFMWMLYSLLKAPFSRIRRMKDKYWDTILLGLVLGFIGVLAGHLSNSAFYYPYVWALMGLITATERAAREQQAYG